MHECQNAFDIPRCCIQKSDIRSDVFENVTKGQATYPFRCLLIVRKKVQSTAARLQNSRNGRDSVARRFRRNIEDLGVHMTERTQKDQHKPARIESKTIVEHNPLPPVSHRRRGYFRQLFCQKVKIPLQHIVRIRLITVIERPREKYHLLYRLLIRTVTKHLSDACAVSFNRTVKFMQLSVRFLCRSQRSRLLIRGACKKCHDITAQERNVVSNLRLRPIPPRNLPQCVNRFRIEAVPCDLCRIPRSDGIGWNILYDDTARAHNRTVSNMNTAQESHIRFHPHITADDDLACAILQLKIIIRRVEKLCICIKDKCYTAGEHRVAPDLYVHIPIPRNKMTVAHIGASAQFHHRPPILKIYRTYLRHFIFQCDMKVHCCSPDPSFC